MSARLVQTAVLLSVLIAPAALAQEKATTATPAPPPPVEVRTSHRVEVIAPGEKVETIIDRMRADRAGPPAPREGRDGVTPPVRGPDRRPGEGAGPPDAPLRPGEGPPGGSGMGPPSRAGDAPPTDRPRR